MSRESSPVLQARCSCGILQQVSINNGDAPVFELERRLRQAEELLRVKETKLQKLESEISYPAQPTILIDKASGLVSDLPTELKRNAEELRNCVRCLNKLVHDIFLVNQLVFGQRKIDLPIIPDTSAKVAVFTHFEAMCSRGHTLLSELYHHLDAPKKLEPSVSQHEFQQLNEKLQKAESEISRLQQYSARASADTRQIEQENARLAAELRQAQVSAYSLESEKQGLGIKIQELQVSQHRTHQLEGQLAQYIKEMQLLQEQYTLQSSHIQELKKEAAASHDQLVLVQQRKHLELEVLQTKATQLEKLLVEATQARDQLLVEAHHTERIQGDLKQRVQHLETEAKRLTDANCQLMEQLSAGRQLGKQVAALQYELTSHEEQLQTIKTQRDIAQNKVASQSTELQRLQEQLAHNAGQLAESTRQLLDLQGTVEHLRSNLFTCETKRAECSRALERETHHSSETSRQAEGLRLRVGELERELAAAQLQQEEERSMLQHRIVSLEAVGTRLKDELAQCSRRAEQFGVDYDQLRHRLGEAERHIENLSARLHKAEEERDEALRGRDEAERERRRVALEICEVQGRIASLGEQLDDTRRLLAKSQAEYQAEVESLHTQLVDTDQQRQTLELEVERLRSDLRATRLELDALQLQAQRLRGEAADADGRARQEEAERRRLHSDAERLRARFEAAERAAVCEKEALVRAALREMELDLREAAVWGWQYGRRQLQRLDEHQRLAAAATGASAAKDRENVELLLEIERLQQEVRALTARTGEAMRLTEESSLRLREAEATILELQRHGDELSAERDALGRRIEELVAQRAQLQSEVGELREAVAQERQLSKRVKHDLEEKVHELLRLQEALDEQQRENQPMADYLRRAEEQAALARQEIQQLRAELSEREARGEQLVTELRFVQEQLTRVEEEKRHLVADFQAVLVPSAETEAREREYELLKEEVARLNEKLHTMRRTFQEELNRVNRERTAEVNQLKHELLTEREDLKRLQMEAGKQSIMLRDDVHVKEDELQDLLAQLRREAELRARAEERIRELEAQIDLLRQQLEELRHGYADPLSPSAGAGFAAELELQPSPGSGTRTPRPYLGLEIVSTDDPSDTRSRDVTVHAVAADSPAAVAGLRPGDVVLSWNGQRVEGRAAFASSVSGAPVGSQVHLEVVRGMQVRTTVLTVGTASRTRKAPARQARGML